MSILASTLLVEVKAQTAEAVAKLGELDLEMKGLGATAAEAGKIASLAFLGIGVALGAVVGEAVKQAADFQEQMTGLVTGAGESKNAIDLVAAGVLKLAGDVGQAPIDLAKGLYLIESAGYHGQAGLDVLRASAIAAKVGMADMPTVANAVTSALNAYGLQAGQSGHVTDVLLQTVAEGKLHFQDLASSLGTILPTASAAHISLGEVGAAMATMTMQGTSADEAATYLRQTILKLEAPTHAAEKALKAMGLGATEVSDTLTHQGLYAALQLVQEHLATEFPQGGAAATAALAAVVGGTKSMQAALELTGPHLATFKANLDGMADAAADGGKTARGWADVQGDLNVQLDQLKATLEAAAISLGDRFLPLATAGVHTIRDFMSAVTAGQTPLVALGATLSGLGLSWTVMVDGAGAALGALGTLLGTFGPVVVAELRSWGDALVGWVQPRIAPLLAELGVLLGQVGTWILTTGYPAIAGQLLRWEVALVEWVAAAIQPLLSALGGLLGPLAAWLSGTGLPLLRDQLQIWAAEFGLWVTYAVPPLMANLGELLGQLGGWVSGTALPAIRAQLGAWAGAFWGWVQDATPMLLERLGEFGQRVVAWLGDAIPALGLQLHDWAQAFVDWVPTAVPPLLGALAGMLGEFTGWMLGTALPAILTNLVTWGAALVEWVAPRIPPLLLELGKVLVGLTAWMLTTALPAIVTTLLSWGQSFITWVAPLIPPLLAEVGKLKDQLIDWLLHTAAPALGTAALQIGTAIIQGIGNGIAAGVGAIEQAAGNAAHAALNAAKGALGISSPSKHFHTVGQQVGQGLQEGILSNIPVVKAAAEALAGTVQGAANDYQTAMQTLEMATQSKLLDIGAKVGEAINSAIVAAAAAIRNAQAAASDAITQAGEALGLSRDIRGRTQAFSAGQSAEQVAYDHAKAISELQYRLHADLEDAKTQKEKDAIQARFDKNVEDLAHREQIAAQDRAFQAQQQTAKQAFDDNLANEALSRTIARAIEVRDKSIDLINQTLTQKETAIEQQAIKEEAALQASYDKQAGVLKAQLIDKLPALTGQAQDLITAFLTAVGAQAATVAGQIVTEMANAAASIAALGSAQAPRLAGATWDAAKGQMAGNTGMTVGSLFTTQYGAQAQQEWERENAGHNAGGTDNWRGGQTWVGEDGPELLTLPRGSRITPASAGAAPVVNIYVSGNTLLGRDPQVAAELWRIIEPAMRQQSSYSNR